MSTPASGPLWSWVYPKLQAVPASMGLACFLLASWLASKKALTLRPAAIPRNKPYGTRYQSSLEPVLLLQPGTSTTPFRLSA